MGGRLSSKELTPKKELGQNFLADDGVVAEMVAAADLTGNGVVVEVGAGTGVLTKELAKRASKVIAFEIDRDLIPVLEKELAGLENVELINKDFLRANVQQLTISNQQFKLIGSIPYRITSPLIHKLLTLRPRPALVVLLIQKEVAQKLTAKAPRATYLSNIAQLIGQFKIVKTVSKESFWPVPEVDGAIIKCSCKACPHLNIDIESFRDFLHRGFQNPRKMLRNKFSTADLESAGIPPTARSQELRLEDWIRLYQQ